MRPRTLVSLAGALGLALALVGRAAAADEPELPPVPEGVEVLARGPVHEAYAEPTQARPEPTPLVAKAPPEPLNEEPPAQRPEGDNVVWIPGYWAFDTDRSDFVWVSGLWRVSPPGRQWVPGGWQEVEGGWHWVAGFWAVAGQGQFDYLPAPPPSVDEGPSTPAPEAGGSYVPGCWIPRESRFFWRPGFWAPPYPGWLWMPSHYVWTPAGYLFVEGFWDRPLESRGLLFAPVAIDRTVLAERRWTYTPGFAIQPDFLLTSLFVRPANGHYYFGDYFEAKYQKAGFIPWVDYRVGRGALDANFAYYRQTFARHEGWEDNLRGLYAARLRGDVPRPPRTWAEQTRLVRDFTVNKTAGVAVRRNINITNVQNVSVLAPLARLHNTTVTGVSGLGRLREGDARAAAVSAHVIKLQSVPRPQVVQEQKAAAQFNAIAVQRRQAEAKILAEPRPTTRPASVTVRQVKIDLPKPPPPPRVDPGVRPGPRVVPPHPTLPPHVERPIPKHEPPKLPAPPHR